ncbi:MAG: N-acetylglucosamine-6-phosphate deacetylase [Lentisphaeria bacterium]|nr:N-acetylglucosamine-6-phosphate deacetylase [Lentisphaeria bacterium]
MSKPYVDLQINGYKGIDFSDPALTEDQFLTTAEHILNSGTALFLPTIVTSPREVYMRNPALIRHAAESHGLLKHIPGLHLEGPFISPKPGAVGAHRPSCVREPDCGFFDEIMESCGNYVKLLTVAPEVPGMDELISHASAKGVVVSCGHQLAGAEDLDRAVKAGAKLLTHLGNGCPNLINRHNNMIWAGMACDDLTAMIITDGQHLPKELIKCIIRCKGVDRVIVTSDAVSVAGLPPGRYPCWDNDAVLEPNGRFHNPVKGCLIGSTFCVRQCAEFLASLGYSEEDIDRMTITNPLKMIGEKAP